MWTPENRKLYDRSDLRYPSDVTDEEWELIKPQIRPPSAADANAQLTSARS